MKETLEFTDEDVLWVPDEEKPCEKIIGASNRFRNPVSQLLNFIDFFKHENLRILKLMLADERLKDANFLVFAEPMTISGYAFAMIKKIPYAIVKYTHVTIMTNEHSMVSSPSDKKQPSFLNWLSYQPILLALVLGYHSTFESCQSTYNLAHRPFYTLFYGNLKYEIPNYYLFSPTIYPVISKRPEWWKYVGPMILDAGTIPVPTKNFIESCSNETLVYVGFGSFSLEEYYADDAHKIKDIIFNTLLKLDFCVIFLNATFKIPPESNDAANSKWHFVDVVPHNLVFPKVNVIIHHGGAGTTQSAQVSGSMAISIPIFDEQKVNSDPSEKLGISITLDNKELSEEILEKAIKDALNVKDVPGKAAKIRESTLGTKYVYEDMMLWLGLKQH